MQTIGRTYSGRKRNYATRCDYCDVIWHRDQLTLDPEGYLACPDDRAGRTAAEIDIQRALDSADPTGPRGVTRQGPL